MNTIFIVAHAPLASALKDCVTHVFHEEDKDIQVFDVLANADPEQLTQALIAARNTALQNVHGVLVLTDLLGATPCNTARRLIPHPQTQVLCGVNVGMVLRAAYYRNRPLNELAQLSLEGAHRGLEILS